MLSSPGLIERLNDTDRFVRSQDYFAGLEQLLRTTPPTEVSLHSAYTKSSLRRVLSDVRAKDLRKAIDALYKRVDKHFGADISSPAAEHTDVLKTVWKACEDELSRLTTNWKGLVQKCYPVSFRTSPSPVYPLKNETHVVSR